MKDFYLFRTYSLLREKLPAFVIKGILKLLPLYILSSAFELVGIFVVFPVINAVVRPAYINENQYLKMIYESINFPNQISFFLFLFVAIFLTFLLKNAFIYFVYKSQSSITFKMACEITKLKYKQYIESNSTFHASQNSAVLLRNIIQIPFELIIYVVLPFTNIINEFLVLLMLIVCIFFFDPLLFVSLMLFALPILFIYGSVFKKQLEKVSTKRDEESAFMYKLGLMSLEGFREIFVFNKLNYFRPKFGEAVRNYSTSLSKIYSMNLFSPKIIETLAVASVCGIFIAGYYLSRDVQALAEFLIVFSVAAYRIIPSLNKIILSANNIKASFFVFDYFDMKTEQIVQVENTQSTNKTIKFSNILEIKNLSLRYVDNSNFALNNINISIKKGERIGLIGPSGSGKSSLLNVLLRLFTETSGGIYLDGTRINDANLDEWLNLISYVPQSVTIFDGTIAENIAFGLDEQNIDYSKIEEAINRTQLTSLIESLPLGLQTQIGEKGVKISGGQRQRIGICRALYHGGEILIMDEATSALDIETEKSLTNAIEEIGTGNLTIIVVAHRIESLKNCTKIYKMSNGVIDPTNYSYDQLRN